MKGFDWLQRRPPRWLDKPLFVWMVFTWLVLPAIGYAWVLWQAWPYLKQYLK